MSQKEKKHIIDYDDSTVLIEGDLPVLIAERQRFKDQEEKAKALKDAKNAEIIRLIKKTRSDGATYTDPNGKIWKATLSDPQPGEELDEAKLAESMAKIGKLAAPVIDKIFAAATVPTEARAQSVTITDPYRTKEAAHKKALTAKRK